MDFFFFFLQYSKYKYCNMTIWWWDKILWWDDYIERDCIKNLYLRYVVQKTHANMGKDDVSKSFTVHVWRHHKIIKKSECLTPTVRDLVALVVGMVHVHTSPQRKEPLQINSEFFWLITFILWWKSSILVGMVSTRITPPLSIMSERSLIGYENEINHALGLSWHQISTQFNVTEKY